MKKGLLFCLFAVWGILFTPSAFSQNPASEEVPSNAINKKIRGVTNPIPQKKFKPDKRQATNRLIYDTSSSVEMYGFRVYDEEGGRPAWVKFNVSAPSSITEIKRFFPQQSAGGGAYVDVNLDGNGSTYIFTTIYDDYSEIYFPNEFIKIDIETGKETSIANYEEMEFLYTDMSYDYSSNLMYAISSNSPNQTVKILTVDLNNGHYKEVLEMSEIYLFTMAIDFDGQMWGINGYGELVKINKNTGEYTKVGSTGVFPQYAQSMEFDHSTGTLYWAFCDDYTSKIMQVNTTTGVATNLGSLQNNAEIVALTIPFRRINGPLAPTDFVVSPGAEGALTAHLSWTNPTENTDGSSATITKVEIYKEEVLVNTIDSPGEKSEWTDSDITERGFITYEIVAYSDAGKGNSAGYTVYIGEDFPGAVPNVKLTEEDGKAVITWDTPESGLNGGWFDQSSLSYTIIRSPGDIQVAEGLKANTFTDTTLPELNLYNYKIIAFNNLGTGGEGISNQLLIGQALTVPYTMEFEEEDNYQIWNIIDSNNDEVTWGWFPPAAFSGSGCMRYQFHRTNTADDWLLSPKFKLENDKSYLIKFKARKGYAPDVEKLAFYILSSPTPDGEKEQLWFKDDLTTTYQEFEVVVTGREAGEYTFGFHACSDPFKLAIYLDDFSIQEYAITDAAVKKLLGPSRAMVGKEIIYKAYIANEGQSIFSNYSVKLMDESENILASVDNGEDIPLKETKVIDIPFTSANPGELKVHIKVESPEDYIEINNYSQELNILILPEDNIFEGKAGYDTKYTAYFPFSFFDKNSVSQSIYYQHEIGIPGMITSLNYFNYFENNEVVNKKLKIWMANTEVERLDTWLPETEFTLVYDGTKSFPEGNNTITFELDYAFEYNGKNLVIMTEKPMDNVLHGNRQYFYCSEALDYPNRTRYYRSDNQQFNWTQAGVGTDMYPNIEMDIALSGGSVSGIIIDGNNPVENATVQIEGTSVKRLTNSKGEYSFDFLTVGSYKLKVSKTGYYELISDEFIVTADSNKEIDLTFTSIPKFTIKGKILIKDTEIGIESALVKLQGYDTFSSLSVKDGAFEINNVHDGYTYNIEVSKAGYKSYSSTIEVKGADIDNMFISLEEIITSVWSVRAEEAGNDVVVTWKSNSSTEPKSYILDDGTAEGMVSFDPPGYGSLGNKFDINDESGIITSVDLYGVTREEAGDRKVTIDIFNESKDIIGSSEPFLIPANDWINISLPNIPYEDSFYVMVNWPATSGKTNSLGYDENGPNAIADLDYICKDGVWGYFHDASPNLSNSVFLIRANVKADHSTLSADTKDVRSERGYNIYRGLVSDIDNVDNWTKLNENVITSIIYTDETWSLADPGVYVYAVKSVYTNQKLSEAVLSNEITKNPSSISDNESNGLLLYPNPFEDVINISGAESINKISIINPLTGIIIKEIYLNDKSQITTEKLNQGIYILSVEKDNGEKIIYKMMKQ